MMINRRGALTNISGGVAAVSLLLATGSRSARAQATIGGADYKMQTLMVGTLSKEQSQIALTQATHPKVKEFAQFEVDEQSTIAQVLSELANPPPAPLDQAHQAILSRLQSTTGKSFDAAYIADQIQGHQQLFAIQQAFLNSKPASMDHEHIAMLARTVIQMHLTMLADLQRMVGAA